jgi:hypothetical protein
MTNMELKLEPCVLNLIGSETQKIQKENLMFINFGVKKFTLKIPKNKKTLMLEYYNLLNPME